MLNDLVVRSKSSIVAILTYAVAFVAVSIVWGQRIRAVTRTDHDAVRASNMVNDGPNFPASVVAL